MAKPLNILIGSGVPKRREGGVAAVIYNLGKELERFGHSITYVFLDDLVTPGSVRGRFSELIFSARLAKYIAKNRSNFDVVNLHAPTGFAYGLRRKFFPKRDDPPYVMTLHGLEERRVRVMKREAARGRVGSFEWKNRMWHRVYHFPRFRWSIRTADAAHVFCRDVWNVLQLTYGMAPDRAVYVPNGVEERFFVPRTYSERGGGLRLLWAGTWLDQRGIFYLREALTHLAPGIPDLTLTIAGPGVPEQEISNYFGPALATRIRIVPVVPAEAMPQLYAEHDAFVFPSLMEGLPTVVMEAMATGMPVITTETCGMPDVVENNFNGLLVPPADARALEAAMWALCHSVELRRRLGENARESMRRHTWEGAARSVEALFQRVAGTEAGSVASVSSTR